MSTYTNRDEIEQLISRADALGVARIVELQPDEGETWWGVSFTDEHPDDQRRYDGDSDGITARVVWSKDGERTRRRWVGVNRAERQTAIDPEVIATMNVIEKAIYDLRNGQGGARVLQLDGWGPGMEGDYVIDPDGRGWGIVGMTDFDHWRSGPDRLVRLQVHEDADHETVLMLLRKMVAFLEGDHSPWDLLSDNPLPLLSD
jgi:hypothetical protein